MAQEIISKVAWSCGERGCTSPGGWHQSNYWVDDTSDTGYTVDRYADGDHEDVEESDLPTPDEINASWREYEAWVAASGLDPLGQFYVPKDVTTQTRHYTVTLMPSILGPIVRYLRRNHRTVYSIHRNLSNQPDEIERTPAVRDYLMAVKEAGRWLLVDDMDADGNPVFKVGSILRLEDIAAHQHLRIRNRQLVVPFTVEVERPDADVRLSRWLKAHAAKS